jgi:hypothetical protein
MADQSEHTKDQDRQADNFEQAAQEKSPSFVSEFWEFLLHNKKWWLAPIVLVLLLLSLLVIGSPATAPFIYTLF